MKITDGSGELQISPKERQQRGIAFAAGALVEALIIGLGVVAGMWFPYQLESESNRYTLITLPDLVPEKPGLKLPPAPRINIPRVPPRKEATPPTPVPRLQVPKIEAPKIQVKLPSPVLPKRDQPVTMAFTKPSPLPPRPVAAVHTGMFSGSANVATLSRPPKDVQTGGFGNPQGLEGEAKGGNSGNVPKLGAFDLPGGPGVGNGTGGSQGSRGTVVSAGFGSGTAANANGEGRGGPGTGGPGVKTGGFEAAAQAAPSPTAARSAAPPPPNSQPVEILSKPSPAYTDEARRLHVEGEVVLSVVFQADGTLRVVGVVKSLGHGLDQAAVQAASQIRFRPAERGGQPVSSPATLHIEFRLA